jgi:TP901 family phage tail tape measure protein
MAITAEDNITFTVTPELNKKQLETDLIGLQKKLKDLDAQIARTSKERGKFNNKNQVQQLANLSKIKSLIVRTNTDIKHKQNLLNSINKFEKENLSITNTQYAMRQRTLETERKISQEKAKQTHASRRGVNETENGTAGFYDTMFGDAGTSFGHKIATTAQYAVAGTALYKLAAAFSEATTAALEFDAIQYKLQYVLGASKDEARALADDFQQLGVTYGSSIDQINEVAVSLGRAGISNDKLAESTKEVIRLALITGDSLADTTSVVVSFEQVFGKAYKSTTQMADALAWTANASRLSTKDLGTLSNYALSAAKTTGMTANSVLALSVAFSNAGVNASTIGTQIRKLGNMMKQSTQGVSQFFQTMGVGQKTLLNEFQNGDATKAFKSFVNDIANMTTTQYNDATAGLNILERDAVDKIRTTHTEILSSLDTLNSDAINGTTAAADKIALSYEQTIARIKNAFTSFAAQKITGGLDALFGGRTNKDIDNFIKLIGTMAHYVALATTSLVLYKVAILSLTQAMKVFTVSSDVATASTISFTRAVRIFNVVIAKNPLMLAATAIAAIGTAMYESYSIMDEQEAKHAELLKKSIKNYHALQVAAEKANKSMFGDVQSAASTYTKQVEETKHQIVQLTAALEAAKRMHNTSAIKIYGKELSIVNEQLKLQKSQLEGVVSVMKTQNVKNFSFVDKDQLKYIQDVNNLISNMSGDKQVAEYKKLGVAVDELIAKQVKYINDNPAEIKIAGLSTDDAAKSLIILDKQADAIKHNVELSKYERGKQLGEIARLQNEYTIELNLEKEKANTTKKQIAINDALTKSKVNLSESEAMSIAKANTAGKYQSEILEAKLGAISKQYDMVSKLATAKERQLRYDELDKKQVETAAKLVVAKAKETRKAILDEYNVQYKLNELNLKKNDKWQTEVQQHQEKLEFLKSELKATEKIGNAQDRISEANKIRVKIRSEEVSIALAKEKNDYINIGTVINNISGQMQNEFSTFMDYASKDFLNFQKLASNILHDIYMEIIKINLTKPLASSMGSFVNMMVGSFSAKGNVFNSPQLSSYSNSIVDKPTAFAFASGGVPNIGVMGEKNGGSPEAILPLTRTPSGDLGVKASGTETVKIEIVNESGNKLSVKDSKVQRDMSGMIISVVIDAINTNKGGLRTAVRGQ